MCPSSKDILLNYRLSWDSHSDQDISTAISLPSHPYTPLEFSSCPNTISLAKDPLQGHMVHLVMYVSLGAFEWDSFLSLFLDFYDLDIFEDYRLIIE